MSGRALERMLDRLAEGRAAALERLFQFLAIPSISTDPVHHDSLPSSCGMVRRHVARDRLQRARRAHGRQAHGRRAIVAPKPDRAPMFCSTATTMCSPPDPLEEWDAPPSRRSSSRTHDTAMIIVARGASDDKGQVMTFFEACRAWHAAHGALPVDVTVLLEGEEESGSPSLAPFLAAHGDELKADLALVCDTEPMGPGNPRDHRFLARSRLLGDHVTGPSRDLHSGLYGGPARNPLQFSPRSSPACTTKTAACHSRLLRWRPPTVTLHDDCRVAHARLRHRKLSRRMGLSAPAGETD